MDYTVLATESLLESQKMWHELEVRKMVEESNFIIECMDLGYIPSTEALQMTPVTESLFTAIIEFFAKIANLFREKAVERSKKYDEWLKEYQDDLINNAKNAKTLELHPIWNGKWREDGAALAKDISNAFKNYEDGKYDDYSFTNRYLSNSSVLTEDSHSELVDSLKVYFKYGLKQSENPDAIKMTGAALSDHIKEMVDFNLNYLTEGTKLITNIDTAIARSLDKLTPPSGNGGDKSGDEKPGASESNTKPTTDSLSVDTWLSIEQRPVSESSLTLLSNYSAVFEKSNDSKKKDPKKDDKTITVVDDDSNSKPGDDNKSNTAGSGDAVKSEDGAKYFAKVEEFAKAAVSAYQTAMDERYIKYMQIFLAITDPAHAPKFDKNGKYISRDKRETGSGDKSSDASSNDKESSEGLFKKLTNGTSKVLNKIHEIRNKKKNK